MAATAATPPAPSAQPEPSAPAPSPAASSAPTPSDSAAPSPSGPRNPQPWLAWRPSGAGRYDYQAFPAPWVGGASPSAFVSVYLPPGYDDPANATRRYPVVYEVPWGPRYWNRTVHVTQDLNVLIDAGRLPPQIVVFIAQNGGPYPDSECVNSADGREQFDTYVAQTVVPWVDGRYRTIASPIGRTIMGFSIGGYCSAILGLRHPDLFGQAIALSGYYTAGMRSLQTPAAWRPFGHDAGALVAYSPLRVATTLPPSERAGLLFIVAGEPAQPFYGPQFTAFTNALRADGYPVRTLESVLGHSWESVRAQLPMALDLVAARQAAAGVLQ